MENEYFDYYVADQRLCICIRFSDVAAHIGYVAYTPAICLHGPSGLGNSGAFNF